MNNLKYKPVDFQETSQREGNADRMQAGQQRLRPFLVVDSFDRFVDSVGGPESKILEYVLAQGLMPA
jgi:hypothetical protein